ncbi:MAG: Bifunctional acetohydroxyacid reductoisomerase [Icmadophila ericetorum]|nr:Bifunctional acetohydroxyacid reductoisomerase [Icmadophila ericetorum]
MASRSFSKALCKPLTQQLLAPKIHTRGFLSLVGGSSRARVTCVGRAAIPVQQVRGVKTIDFAGHKEQVFEREDWPREKLLDYFKNDTLALIGYGSQGHGQGLNLRDNGLNVIIGVRKNGQSWKEAQQDGWILGTNLFEVDEAISKGTIVMNLLSDAAQSETWPAIKPQLTKGKTLYFSHGFSPVFKDLTKVDVPTDIDVILVAPKGSGRTVRTLFKEGRGINSSIAVYQDVTGKAEEKAIALGVAVGSGYLYKTTFEKEVYSDLYGERGCLMGGIHGMFLAQYEVLRERGHSPSEAFNETVEEATQSLYPLIGANGMDWMYEACSTTARRGAIDWSSKFKDTLKPVFNELYDSVKTGKETKRSLEYNSQPDYREKYEKEMQEIRDLEIWRAGKAVRWCQANEQSYIGISDKMSLTVITSSGESTLSIRSLTPDSDEGNAIRPSEVMSVRSTTSDITQGDDIEDVEKADPAGKNSPTTKNSPIRILFADNVDWYGLTLLDFEMILLYMKEKGYNMGEIFAELFAREIYPHNDGTSRFFRRVETDYLRIRRNWSTAKKEHGESPEDKDWLILPSMLDRGITLIVEHEEKVRKEQTLLSLLNMKGGKRFAEALIPVMTLTRLQAEMKHCEKTNFESWQKMVCVIAAVNAANPITHSLISKEDEMYYDVDQGAADVLVYSFPGNYTRKNLIQLLGIRSVESVRNPFEGAFDVRCLTVKDAQRIVFEFDGKVIKDQGISVVAINPAMAYYV